MSKLFAFVCAVSALAISALADNPHGDCGEDVLWAYDPDIRTLTMNGTGPTYDYPRLEQAPWYTFRDEIEHLIVGEGVTSIGLSSFFFCDNLTTVKFPSTLRSVRDGAFEYCKKLSSVNFPEGLKRIGLTAFNGCAIPYVKLPKSLEVYGFNCFGGCPNLTAIDVDPDNPIIKSIDGVLFNKTIPKLLQYPGGKAGPYTIPSFVETIGGNAFWGAHLLTSLVVPPSVTEVAYGMVHGCTSLKHLYLPDTITSTDSFAFCDCSSLETLVLPAKLKSLGSEPFDGCKNLKAISYLGSSEPECGNYMWYGADALKVICVPESYNSTTLCGKAITCRSSSCGLLDSQCHDWSAEGDTCSFEQKKSVKEWENHTTDCLNYVCENQEGFIAKSKCDDELMKCMEDKCFEKDKVEGKKWVVYIEFNASDIVIPESDELTKELSNLSKVDEYDMKVVIEYDGNGGVKRVLVYVDDEDQANDIVETVNKLDKGASCEGILCKSIKAKAEDLSPKISPSGANHIHSVMAMFVAMVFILLSIY